MLLLRNKDPEYKNSLASFATRLCRQRSEPRTCAKRVGLAITTLSKPRNKEERSPTKIFSLSLEKMCWT